MNNSKIYVYGGLSFILVWTVFTVLFWDLVDMPTTLEFGGEKSDLLIWLIFFSGVMLGVFAFFLSFILFFIGHTLFIKYKRRIQ